MMGISCNAKLSVEMLGNAKLSRNEREKNDQSSFKKRVLFFEWEKNCRDRSRIECLRMKPNVST